MIEKHDDRIVITGAFNQHTIPALIAQGDAFVRESACRLDLSAVEHVDSAAVATVIGWVRLARAAGRRLPIIAEPEAFHSLSALYGVDAMLFPPAEGEQGTDA